VKIVSSSGEYAIDCVKLRNCFGAMFVACFNQRQRSLERFSNFCLGCGLHICLARIIGNACTLTIEALLEPRAQTLDLEDPLPTKASEKSGLRLFRRVIETSDQFRQCVVRFRLVFRPLGRRRRRLIYRGLVPRDDFLNLIVSEALPMLGAPEDFIAGFRER